MAKTLTFYRSGQGTYFETSHSAENLKIWSILSMCSVLPIWDTGKSSCAFSESQDMAAEVCASFFTGTLGLVSGLIRTTCMQVKWCHPCQELKLGCSRKIIRNKDSLAKNLSCVGQKSVIP